MFLNDAGSEAALRKSNIPEKAANFVTFSENSNQMKRWELDACVRVTADPKANKRVVEANLQSLARDFGACIAISALYGQDFLDRCPQLLSDFWKFDTIFPLLMIGVPSWFPLKMIKEGIRARSRMLDQMGALYKRIEQYQQKQPVDFGADMSDVGDAALGRSKAYTQDQWSYRHRGQIDFSILWGQNANTQATLFWLLLFIYSNPDILRRLREETAPHVKLSQEATPSILDIDLAALSRECPLFKACTFETFRMANDATSIRYVERSITVDDKEYRQELKPGTFVSVPHSLSQRDPSIYADPNKFVPDRFLTADEVTGKLTARYGKLKPWGSGSFMCKGRTFAEKELVTLSTAIISLWDIDPVTGSWQVPAMLPGTGAKKPAEDVRVKISRRIVH